MSLLFSRVEYPTTTPLLSSAKRKKQDKLGVAAWHPYYAGYSGEFVKASISYLNLSKHAVILDPWHGSGTTGFVAQKYGIACIGTEINPVIAHFAAAKSQTNLLPNLAIAAVLAQIIASQSLLPTSLASESEELINMIGLEAAVMVRSTAKSLQECSLPSVSFIPQLHDCLIPGTTPNHPARSFFLAAFFKALRSVLSYQVQSNPTWIGSITPFSFNQDEFLQHISVLVQSMKADMIYDGLLPASLCMNATCEGNSRSLPISDRSISAIITSPPYLTRIDYAMATKLELLTLGSPSSLRRIRELTTGAPIILKDTPIINEDWGLTCVNFLRQVKEHPTKAAGTYYLKNFLQYFSDVFASLSEIKRVLQRNGKALIVLQASYFKDVYVDLTKMYQEMSELLGMQARVISSENVKVHLAHINTKSSKYIKNKSYTEDVIELSFA